ncbi:putative folate metabolism gamma-glutamate ligase [bacterium]|nr:MAG: putative folate metabolism gamma-glutamate ligase [bacterium]
MKFIPVKTRAFLPPKDDIYQLFGHYLPRLREGDILFITSKILAIHQGRCVKIRPGVRKDDLIIKEAEKFIPRDKIPKGYVVLTIKGYTLIPSAGIDESNGNGYYILWPKNISKAARTICNFLKKKFKLKKLAVVITDSHTTPLRYGVTGISLGFFGILPLVDYRETPDIFGRKLKITRTNIIDPLAAMAVLLMGEGKERTPMLVLRGTNFIKFTNKDTFKMLIIPKNLDIYAPLLKVFQKEPKFDRKRKTK